MAEISIINSLDELVGRKVTIKDEDNDWNIEYFIVLGFEITLSESFPYDLNIVASLLPNEFDGYTPTSENVCYLSIYELIFNL